MNYHSIAVFFTGKCGLLASFWWFSRSLEYRLRIEDVCRILNDFSKKMEIKKIWVDITSKRRTQLKIARA